MRLALLGALLLAGCAAAPREDLWTPIPAGPPLTADTEARVRRAGAEILFWSQAQKDANFPHMEQLFPGHVVRAGDRVRPLPAGAPLPIPAAEIDAFVARQNVAGLIVLDRGRVRLERYGRGFDAAGRWTSFSVAKSFTSTLVGAAIRDGAIRGLDDPVTRYLPELGGSAYEGVSVRQLLTMTSGVRWNEDYTDPASDVVRMYAGAVPAGVDPTIAYLKTLPREAAPGSKWVYKTGETNLIGVLVARATGKPLANYLSARVFGPAGMERDGFWMVDGRGQEIAGCCLSVSLRDYARLGQFVLDGGRGVVPDGWFRDALAPQQQLGGGNGYGYQWWTYPQGAGAQGIFGQSIYVDQASGVVVAIVSAWEKATDQTLGRDRAAMQRRIVEAVVGERR